MKRNILFILAITIVIAGSCKKENKPATPVVVTPPPVVIVPKNPVTLIPDTSAHGGPGKIITYNTPESITKDTIMAKIGTSTVVLYKTGGKQLSLLLPVISSGSYDVSFKLGDQPYATKAIVDNYTPITDPELAAKSFIAVIDSYVNNFKSLNADTSAVATKIEPGEMNFVTDYEAAFKTQWASLSATDKLKTAYYLKNIIPDVSLLTKLKVNASGLHVNGKITFEDVAADLLGRLTLTLSVSLIVATEAPAISGYLLTLSPLATAAVIIGTGVAVGLTLIYLHNRFKNQASYKYLLDKIDEIKGKSLSLPDHHVNIQSLKTYATSPISLFDKKPNTLQLTGSYRSLQISDINSSSVIIKSVVAIDGQLETAWNKLKTHTDGIGSFFRISSKLPAYNKVIPTTGVVESKAVTPDYITIKNISDPTIKITSSINTGLQITAESVSQLTAEKNFSFDVIYNYDNFKISSTKTVSAVLKPTIDSVALLKAKVWTAYQYYFYDPETGQQSCNVIGNGCTIKGPYYEFRFANGSVVCGSWSLNYIKYGSLSYDFKKGIAILAMSNFDGGGSIGDENVRACVNGTPIIGNLNSPVSAHNLSVFEYRVLNGWIEVRDSATASWRKSNKIIKLNSNELELEAFSSNLQWNFKCSYGNKKYFFNGFISYTPKPGLADNMLGSHLFLK